MSATPAELRGTAYAALPDLTPTDFSCFVLQTMEAALGIVASGGEVSTHALRYMHAHQGAAAQAIRGYQAIDRAAVLRAYERQSRRVRELLS